MRTETMKREQKQGTRLTIASFAAAILCSHVAVATETVEDFNAGDTAGWQHASTDVVLSNPGDHLEAEFKAQGIPTFVHDVVWVDLGHAMVMTNISFRFNARDLPPSLLRVVLRASTNDHSWYRDVPVSTAGAWVNVSVSMEYTNGWFIGAKGGEALFAEDVRCIDEVGLYIRRHSAKRVQEYGIDDFTIQGLTPLPNDQDLDGIPDDWEHAHGLSSFDAHDARRDPDGDGMDNYGEYRSGTDPNDPNSVLAVRVDRLLNGIPVEGVVLRWPSASNRTYAVWHTLDLTTQPMAAMDSGIVGAPPTNIYHDLGSTNSSGGIYHIRIEED